MALVAWISIDARLDLGDPVVIDRYSHVARPTAGQQGFPEVQPMQFVLRQQ
jgi:hypothetical protein